MKSIPLIRGADVVEELKVLLSLSWKPQTFVVSPASYELMRRQGDSFQLTQTVTLS